jgi:large conductance mechanosensitive channel
MMGVLAEFKKFALRGSVVDLAVGFTVGAAFSTIAKSLVNDIIMPPIGLALGRVDFTDLFLVLRQGPETPGPYVTLEAARTAGAVTINFGLFINSLVTFLLIALAMFAVVRLINRIDEKLEDEFGAPEPTKEEPAQKKCPYCHSTIPHRATRCPQCTSVLDADALRARSGAACPP